MPYRSKAQHRKFRALESRGALPKGTASTWAHHTKSMQRLPEHASKEAADARSGPLAASEHLLGLLGLAKTSEAHQGAPGGLTPVQLGKGFGSNVRASCSPGLPDAPCRDKQADLRGILSLITHHPPECPMQPVVESVLTDKVAADEASDTHQEQPPDASVDQSTEEKQAGSPETQESGSGDLQEQEHSKAAVDQSTARSLAALGTWAIRDRRFNAFLDGPSRSTWAEDRFIAGPVLHKLAYSALGPPGAAWQQMMGMMSGPGAQPQPQQPGVLSPPVQPNAQGAVDPGTAHVGPQSNSATNPIGTFGLNTSTSSMSGFGSQNNVVMKQAATITDQADAWDPTTSQFRLVDVQRLLAQLAGRQPERLALNQIWGGTEQSPGFSEERLAAADTQYPIVVDSYHEGPDTSVGLVDGRHRKIKLQRAGETHANVVRITPDDIAASVAPAVKQAAVKIPLGRLLGGGRAAAGAVARAVTPVVAPVARAVASVVKPVVSPRLPGLDRRTGLNTNLLGTSYGTGAVRLPSILPPQSSRPLDRTRQLAAKTIRGGGQAAAVASLGSYAIQPELTGAVAATAGNAAIAAVNPYQERADGVNPWTNVADKTLKDLMDQPDGLNRSFNVGKNLRYMPGAGKALDQFVVSRIMPFSYGHRDLTKLPTRRYFTTDSAASEETTGFTAMRRELLRRSLGLPVPGDAHLFKPLGLQHYAPNAAQGVPTGRYETVEFTPHGVQSLNRNLDVAATRVTDYSPLSGIFGTHGYTPGPDGSHKIEDLWDFALSDKERSMYSPTMAADERRSLLMRNIAQGYMPESPDGGRGVVFRQNLRWVPGTGYVVVPEPVATPPLIKQNFDFSSVTKPLQNLGSNLTARWQGLAPERQADIVTLLGSMGVGAGVNAATGALGAEPGYRMEAAKRDAFSGALGGVAGFAALKGTQKLFQDQHSNPVEAAVAGLGGTAVSKLIHGLRYPAERAVFGRPSWDVLPEDLAALKNDLHQSPEQEEKQAIDWGGLFGSKKPAAPVIPAATTQPPPYRAPVPNAQILGTVLHSTGKPPLPVANPQTGLRPAQQAQVATNKIYATAAALPVNDVRRATAAVHGGREYSRDASVTPMHWGMAAKIEAAGHSPDHPAVSSGAAADMVQQRWGGHSWPDHLQFSGVAEPGQSTGSFRRGTADKPPVLTIDRRGGGGFANVLNHELAHAVQGSTREAMRETPIKLDHPYPPRGGDENTHSQQIRDWYAAADRRRKPVEEFTAEVGPSLGSALFSGEEFHRLTGKPLDHTMQFPSGKQHQLPWMVNQAKQHGYFDGKSMDELLASPEGVSWLKQMVSGVPGQEKQNADKTAALPLRGIGTAIGKAMLGGARAAGGAAVRGVKTLPHTATFVASVPNNYASMSPGAKVLDAVKTPFRAAFSPRYPGLDRPVGFSTKSFVGTRPAQIGRDMKSGTPMTVPVPKLLPPEVQRPFDRTRQFAANTMRTGSRLTSAATLGAGVVGTLYEYPKHLAAEIGSATGMHGPDQPKLTENLQGRNMVRHGLTALSDFVSPAKDPLSQLHRDVITETAIPQARHDIYLSRKRQPFAYGLLDALRSLTPAGAAGTAALRLLGSEQAPNPSASINRNLKKQAPALLDPANADAVQESPYAKMWDRIFPRKLLPTLTEAAVIRPAWQQAYVPAFNKINDTANAGEQFLNRQRDTISELPLKGIQAINQARLPASFAAHAAAGTARRGLDATQRHAGAAVGAGAEAIKQHVLPLAGRVDEAADAGVNFLRDQEQNVRQLADKGIQSFKDTRHQLHESDYGLLPLWKKLRPAVREHVAPQAEQALAPGGYKKVLEENPVARTALRYNADRFVDKLAPAGPDAELDSVYAARKAADQAKVEAAWQAHVRQIRGGKAPARPIEHWSPDEVNDYYHWWERKGRESQTLASTGS